MSSKPLEVRVPNTDLPTLVEKKSKQMDLNDTPEPKDIQRNFVCRNKALGMVHTSKFLSAPLGPLIFQSYLTILVIFIDSSDLILIAS